MNVKDEMTGRKLLVDYGKKLLDCSLVQGTWGNLSVRLDDQYMLVTPSGLDYNRVTPEDMVKVELKTLSYESENKPTSEKGLHGGIYLLRPEIGAVIHTHSKYCSIFAATNMPLQVDDGELQNVLGDFLQVAKYGLPGTKNLTKNTIKALGQKAGCIMSHHGMICCGENIEDALMKCQAMEKAAEMFVNSRYKG